MNNAEIIGVVAAILTTGSFLPQAIKVLRTRQTEAISLIMYSMFTAGVATWLVYGAMTTQWSITIANAITLVLSGTILVMKLRAVIVAARAPRVKS
jgi:MtN3 and saliva related transmembrane protein